MLFAFFVVVCLLLAVRRALCVYVLLVVGCRLRVAFCSLLVAVLLAVVCCLVCAVFLYSIGPSCFLVLFDVFKLVFVICWCLWFAVCCVLLLMFFVVVC